MTADIIYVEVAKDISCCQSVTPSSDSHDHR